MSRNKKSRPGRSPARHDKPYFFQDDRKAAGREKISRSMPDSPSGGTQTDEIGFASQTIQLKQFCGLTKLTFKP
jgi:hypothetical protein